MKLQKIEIQNIKSFRHKTDVDLNEGLNVIIGTNAGGKTNFINIISVVMNRFVSPSYSIRRDKGSDSTFNFKLNST